MQYNEETLIRSLKKAQHRLSIARTIKRKLTESGKVLDTIAFVEMCADIQPLPVNEMICIGHCFGLEGFDVKTTALFLVEKGVISLNDEWQFVK